MKLNKEDMRVSIKNGGSKYDKDLLYVKTEMFLDSYFSMENVLKAVYNPELRKQWDKNVVKIERTDLSKKGAKIVY